MGRRTARVVDYTGRMENYAPPFDYPGSIGARVSRSGKNETHEALTGAVCDVERIIGEICIGTNP